MAVDEDSRKAFDFASDASKQLITLATGILALTITFIKDIAGGVSGSIRGLLVWSWVAYLGSVLFGVWTLLALTTGLAARPQRSVGPSGVFDRMVRLPAALQVLAFLVGLGLTVAFGIRAL